MGPLGHARCRVRYFRFLLRACQCQSSMASGLLRNGPRNPVRSESESAGGDSDSDSGTSGARTQLLGRVSHCTGRRLGGESEPEAAAWHRRLAESEAAAGPLCWLGPGKRTRNPGPPSLNAGLGLVLRLTLG